MAARPRTLPAAVAPVLVGTALAATEGTFKVLTFVAALLGALFIQVGTNLSNDYSDARRGADTEDRLGPVRVTAGGLVPPRQVLVATYVAFGLAVLAGAYLIATAGWELLLVGAASILAGVLYTGGPRPYGYEGLGEVFVFLFFGVVAVAGSYFAQVEQLEWEALVLAVPVGLLAAAILVVNNVRDLETDRRAGKRTLAVRMGRERTRRLYVAMVAGAFVTAQVPWLLGSLSPWLLLSLLAVPLALPVIRTVRTHTDGPALNGALAGTGSSSSRSASCSPRASWRADAPRASNRSRCALREPLATAWGELDRARAAARAARPTTGSSGRRGRAAGALRRRRRSRAVRAALDAYAAVLARLRRGGAARGLPRRARPAAGARRGRPRAVGPRRAGAPGARWRS